MVSVSEFQKSYVKAIQDGSAAIFAGAGIGMASGYMNWKNLLRDFAKSINLDVDKENDLVEVAQFYKNERGSRHEINKIILNEFIKEASDTKIVDLLASMPISCYWTTNYDHLIEDSLKRCGKIVDSKISPESLSVTMHDDAIPVYKMHGDCSDPINCVITKDDYEIYNKTRNVFTLALQGDLITKTFLFVGFSFEDPNLKYILSRIRILLGENVRSHYCFFEKITRKPKQSKKDFEYIYNKQQLKIRDLKRYGIQAVMLDSYAQISDILEHIKLQARTQNVFISGAAHTYGEQWDKKGTFLISSLTRLLYNNGHRIITGYARGIGSYIVSTILEMTQSKSSLFESHILIRSFPYESKNDPNYDEKKAEYRNSIAAMAGINFFIFGNKESKRGECVLSVGMWDEYIAALSHNSYIIPIGSTGFMAKKIYEDILKKREQFPYLSKKDLNILGKSNSPEQICQQVQEILLRIKEL